MKEIKSFTIDRNIWLRGEQGYLLRNDGKMDCLGIYLNKCGIAKKNLINKEQPSEIEQTIPDWLIADEGQNSNLALELMDENDFVGAKEYEREYKIKKLFKYAGITVRFKNGW